MGIQFWIRMGVILYMGGTVLSTGGGGGGGDYTLVATST